MGGSHAGSRMPIWLLDSVDPSLPSLGALPWWAALPVPAASCLALVVSGCGGMGQLLTPLSPLSCSTLKLWDYSKGKVSSGPGVFRVVRLSLTRKRKQEGLWGPQMWGFSPPACRLKLGWGWTRGWLCGFCVFRILSRAEFSWQTVLGTEDSPGGRVQGSDPACIYLFSA